MELFDYLMAKNGHNLSTRGDLFSYLLGKKASRGSGTYTTFSGTSLNISDTIKAKIKKFMLNSTELTQEGTPTIENPIPVEKITGDNNIEITGKNLYDESKITDVSTFRSTATINDDKSITITSTGTNGYAIIIPYFNFKANETYTVSFDVDNIDNYNHMYLFINTSTTSGGYSRNPYVTITKTTDSLLGIGIYPNANATITISNIQIEKNTTKTSYEPYQAQNYPITLSSKNLFNLTENDFNNGETVGAGKKIILTLKPNTNYTLSSNAPGSSSETNIWFNGGSSATNGVFDGTPKTFSTDSNGNIYISIRTNQINNIFANYWIQLEEGSTATEYEPYYNIEYCKIGDYRDQIFKNTIDSEFYDSTLIENEWYLKKNIGKVTFDGSESGWNLSTSYNSYSFWVPNNQFSFLNSRYKKYCNLFQYSSLTFDTAPNPSLCENTGTLNMILFKTNGDYGETVTEWKEWLSSHHVQVYCPLETPQYIHISETDYPILRSQLEDLHNNAKSYNGQTIITQTNEELPFNISVDVKVLDTNLNMINSLNSSLLSNNLQNEEETSLGNTNGIDEIEEPIEEYEEL